MAAAVPMLHGQITIPAGFTKSVLAGKQSTIAFSRIGTGLGADYDEILVKRAAYSVLADLTAADKKTGATTPEAFREVQSVPRTLTLEIKPAGTRRTARAIFRGRSAFSANFYCL